MVNIENVYSAFFTYAFLFLIVVYAGNLRTTFKLLTNYFVLFVMVIYVGSKTVTAIDYSKINYG